MVLRYILDLSKIEAGKMEFHYEKVNVEEIAKTAIENTRHLNIAISMEIPENLSPVLADRDKLIIVLNNLLINALKFTYNGGRVLLLAKEEKDDIEIRVENTGIGIDKDTVAKIFEKFYQADSSSRRKRGGSGLGLTIEVRPLDYELCINAAIAKTKYNIAFSDCFLLALSEHDNATVLFKNVESEMKQNINELNNRFNLKFLEDYS